MSHEHPPGPSSPKHPFPSHPPTAASRATPSRCCPGTAAPRPAHTELKSLTPSCSSCSHAACDPVKALRPSGPPAHAPGCSRCAQSGGSSGRGRWPARARPAPPAGPGSPRSVGGGCRVGWGGVGDPWRMRSGRQRRAPRPQPSIATRHQIRCTPLGTLPLPLAPDTMVTEGLRGKGVVLVLGFWTLRGGVGWAGENQQGHGAGACPSAPNAPTVACCIPPCPHAHT